MTESSASNSREQLAQAKLFAEAARRLDAPADALPPGDSASMLLVLWQRAARSATAAARCHASDATPLLQRAAGGPELLRAAEELMNANLADVESGAVERVAVLSTFSKRLIAELDGANASPRLRRWRQALRLAVQGVVPLLGLVIIAVVIIRGPDLAVTATRTLSSQASTCEKGECGNATLHTNFESSPWVRYDFGRVRALHSISIENRTDCCLDRAIPLVVETSDDGFKWQEQVRFERASYVFKHPLRVKARYLRLRIAGRNYLHLHSVTIR